MPVMANSTSHRQPLAAGFVAGTLVVALLWYLSQSSEQQYLPAVTLRPRVSSPQTSRSTSAPSTLSTSTPHAHLMSVQGRHITAGQHDPCLDYALARPPTPDEQNTIVVLSPDARAASFFMSHRVQYYSSAYTYRLVMLEDSDIGSNVDSFLNWTCYQHPGPKVSRDGCAPLQ